jgi:hypothetical protein
VAIFEQHGLPSVEAVVVSAAVLEHPDPPPAVFEACLSSVFEHPEPAKALVLAATTKIIKKASNKAEFLRMGSSTIELLPVF